jgi:hypothetical protein
MTTWTPEEQREHRKLWVEALRSGKYTQGTGALLNEGNYCCLGVACDISELGRWDDDDYVVPAPSQEDGVYRACDVLPPAVQQWLGLSDNGGAMPARPALFQENDDHGKSFAEIADIIESEPPGLVANV